MTSQVAETKTLWEDLVNIRDHMLTLEFTEVGAGGPSSLPRLPNHRIKQLFAVIFSETVE